MEIFCMKTTNELGLFVALKKPLPGVAGSKKS